MKASPSRSAKQRWPFVKKRVYPNGSVGWQVDARTKDGGERKTFGTQREAETFAEQCRIRRGNEGVGAMADVELASYGWTVRRAIAFALEHLRRQERSIDTHAAIAELIAMREGAGKSARYCQDLRLRLGRFEKDFGARTVASITAKELDGWLSGLAVAAGTRNTFRRDLRTLFSFCVKRDYATSNPAAATERAKEIDAPPGILTVAECAKLLASCGDDMLPFIAIGMFAGLRSAELEKLDWREVDLAGGFIEVTASKSKTARRRLVRVSENLPAWLAPHAQMGGPIAPPALRYRFDDVKEAAGFGPAHPWPQNALRHSFGSYWLAQHQDAAALALQMGNSQAMVFAHYRELVKPKDAARFWALSPAAEAAAKVVRMAAH